MKTTLLLLASFCSLLACQSAPKSAPTDAELDQSLRGLKQAGFDKFKCKLKVRSFDKVDESLEQSLTNHQFGRTFRAEEIAIIKDYDLKLVVNEQEAKLEGSTKAELADSPNVRKFSSQVKSAVLDAGDELSRFFVDLTLDIKGLQPELVSGGYLYETSRGAKIRVASDFDHIEIKESKSSGSDLETEADLKRVNGFQIPTRVKHQYKNYFVAFYKFDESKTPPTLQEIEIGYGASSAATRYYFTFNDCQNLQ